MTPNYLMTLGAAVGVVSFAMMIMAPSGFMTGQFVVILFGAGAIFGKGYGVWEERNRDGSRKD